MHVLIKINSPNPLNIHVCDRLYIHVCTYIHCLVVFSHTPPHPRLQTHTHQFTALNTSLLQIDGAMYSDIAFPMPRALNPRPLQLHGGALAVMASAPCTEHITSSLHAWHFCQRCGSWSTCLHDDLNTTHHASCM